MTLHTIKTFAYLDQKTRHDLDAFARRRNITISQAIRQMISEGLERDNTSPSNLFVNAALSALLRYHPTGDLERVVNEAIKLSGAIRHG